MNHPSAGVQQFAEKLWFWVAKRFPALRLSLSFQDGFSPSGAYPEFFSSALGMGARVDKFVNSISTSTMRPRPNAALVTKSEQHSSTSC
jgi:hypothetical protein